MTLKQKVRFKQTRKEEVNKNLAANMHEVVKDRHEEIIRSRQANNSSSLYQ